MVLELLFYTHELFYSVYPVAQEEHKLFPFRLHVVQLVIDTEQD